MLHLFTFTFTENEICPCTECALGYNMHKLKLEVAVIFMCFMLFFDTGTQSGHSFICFPLWDSSGSPWTA
jgi:hypothetical protein